MKTLSLGGRWMGLLAGICVYLTAGFSARAQIAPTNLITVVAPTDGEVFTTPANIEIDAVTPPDVQVVTFTAAPGGGVLPQFGIYLGTVSNGVVIAPGHKLFVLTWSNAPPGTWVLTAGGADYNGVGRDGSQRVTITVQHGPGLFVDLAAPTNGAMFSAPASIQLIAGVRLTNGDTVASVEFFDGGRSIGVSSNGAVVDPPGMPGLVPGDLGFLMEWTNVPAGIHVLTAEAFDHLGQTAYSAPVTIFVNSNAPPVVRITSPPNNSFFRAPVNIPLLAYAHDPAGYVASVQFFAGSNSFGFGVPLAGAEPLPTPLVQTNVFQWIWTNAPAGSNTITAVAVNNAGLAATSAPVNIFIAPPPPPPSNEPTVVSIVASDPIAIAGTNCWRWLGLADTNGPAAWSNWVSPTALFRWFTNCGPDDAVFTVHRMGPTNNSLTVAYSLGGTASNGVDYALLPGTVTIPAGQTEAAITIVPMDGQTNASVETLIIGLTPSTNRPSDYVLGLARAEAIIIDSETPRAALAGAMLGDRSFHLSMQGPDGAWFRVDDTADGLDWTPVCTNQVINGSIDFTDPGASGASSRFYRVVPLGQAPSN